MTRLSLAFVFVSSLVLGMTGCKNQIVTQSKTSLEATKPLLIAFDQDVTQCDEHICIVGLAVGLKSDQADKVLKLLEESRVVRVYGDGTYRIFEGGDPPEKPEPEEPPENWRETPEKTDAELAIEVDEKYMGNMIKELTTGSLAELDGKKVLEIAPDLLPTKDFVLFTNGWFGASYNDELIGSPTVHGVTKISR